MTLDQALQVAFQHHHAGRLAEAQVLYQQILSEVPNQPDALHMLGLLMSQRGQLDQAVALIGRTVAAHANFPQAYSNLGKLLCDLGQFEAAIRACRRALELQASLPDAHFNLANALASDGQFEASLSFFRRAIQLNPGLPSAHTNFVNALIKLHQLDEAAVVCQTAINLAPQLPVNYRNLSVIFALQGRLEEAVAAANRAIGLNPNDAISHNNLGVALTELGELDQAIAAFGRAIQIDPKFADAHWNLAQQLLLHGDFRAGWPQYQWREKIKRLMPQSFSQPQWDGGGLTGKTILLHAEQGMGDTIQFVRYIPLVARRNPKAILVQCQPALAHLLKANFPSVQIISSGAALPAFDLHIPLLSLGAVFETDLNSIPASVPYLKPDAQLQQDWSTRIVSANQELNVGLCWAGNPNHWRDRTRSIPLRQFASLARCKNVRFHSLQVGAGAEQIGGVPGLNLLDQTGEPRDFADTAALVANLDLVITVDTAVAHLAAALGKPTWLLIGQVPDWRWLLERQDSPWYPTIRLFRQATRGDWVPVIQRVAAELNLEAGRYRKGAS